MQYELVRSARRTLAIQIGRDGRVVVRAPARLPRIEIERFVADRADWIRGHLAALATRPPALRWGEGRHWWHLGRALPVRPATLPGRQRVMLGEEALLVTGGLWAGEAPGPEPSGIEAALQAWQLRLAAELLPARLDAVVQTHGEAWRPAGLRLRRMRSRWGSCSRDGRVCLNSALLHADPDCIDYVICHELAHLREFNHGPRFHAWMDRLCPDWPDRKRLLERQASLWSAGRAAD